MIFDTTSRVKRPAAKRSAAGTDIF